MTLFQTMVLELSKRNGLYCEDTSGKKALCDKFGGCTAESTKSKISEDFTQTDGNIRIVFATVALIHQTSEKLFTGVHQQTLNYVYRRLDVLDITLEQFSTIAVVTFQSLLMFKKA